MLKVDLSRLRRDGQARIDAEVPPDDPFFEGLPVQARAPLEVHLQAQQAGPDVVVRGTVKGEFDLECRRCLEPVVAGIEEEVGLLYKAGELDEDEPEDVLSLPAGAELDLTPPIWEQVLVAVPQYVSCRPECRGLCPTCGVNRNVETCECTQDEVDDRWAPLRQLKRDE